MNTEFQDDFKVWTVFGPDVSCSFPETTPFGLFEPNLRAGGSIVLNTGQMEYKCYSFWC